MRINNGVANNADSTASEILYNTINRTLMASANKSELALSHVPKQNKIDIEEDVDYIYRLFQEFSDAYGAEWERLEKCARLYRGTHWQDVALNDSNEPRPVTPIIQSTIENVRAELSDQYPTATITADNTQYSGAAEMLSSVIRENHIACEYEREYERLTYDLLVGGYMVQEVGFDPDLNYGLGGAYVRCVDNQTIMFDPNASRLEDCRAVFKFAIHPMSWFYEHYPKKALTMNTDELLSNTREDDFLRTTRDDRVMLIECWRRQYDSQDGRYHVHVTKVAGRVLLEDSRATKPQGMYAHGKYPFTITPLFMRKGCMLGYGFADMFEQQQRFSDKLDQIVLKNALMASHNKLLVSSASGFDVADLRDWSKEVHCGENLNGVKWFSTSPLPAYIIDYIQRIRESVREESGANDFSRGSATGGVTAASAIAALQEMSNKRSRTIAKNVHLAFADAVRMELEVEREYSEFTRPITGNNGRAAMYSNSIMCDDDSYPLEFKVSVNVARESRFSILSQNETVLKLVEMGMLTPQIGLSMLKFDGKDEAIAKMTQGGEGEVLGQQ